MRMSVRLGERRLGGWTDRVLGRLNVLDHVGRGTWCSRDPHRPPVAEKFQRETARAGTIGGTKRTCVGLHTLHARPMSIELGYLNGYRFGGHVGPRVPGALLQTELQTAFSHGLIELGYVFY